MHVLTACLLKGAGQPAIYLGCIAEHAGSNRCAEQYNRLAVTIHPNAHYDAVARFVDKAGFLQPDRQAGIWRLVSVFIIAIWVFRCLDS